MTIKRTYKGWEIHKQHVGNCGWNVVNPQGRCVTTGRATLAAAREFIDFQIEAVDLAEMFRVDA